MRRFLLLLVFVPSLFAQEFAVTPPVPVPGVENQFPAAATSGDLTLVAWSDTRNLGDIYAARLDAAGHVLDPNGIFLAHSTARAAVVATGSGDFVVALRGQTSCGQIDVLKVSRDGAVSARKTIADISPRCAENVRMATNGTSILLLVNDTRFFLLDNDGNVLTTSATLTDRDDPAAVASDGHGYAIAIATPTAVTTIAVSPNGDAGPTAIAFSMVDVNSIAIASNGSGYVLAAASKTQLTIAGNDFSKSTPLSGPPSAVQLVWTGSSYVVAWMQPLPPPLFQPSLFTSPVSAAGDLPGIAAVGTSNPFFALTPAMTVRVDDAFHLVARPLGGGNDVVVVMTPSPQASPLIVRTPNGGGVVVWHELSPDTTDAETLDALGRPTGNVVTNVDPATLLAFDGANVVFGWVANQTLFARRYTPSLVPVDPAPIAIGHGLDGASAPQVAAGGGTALFVWRGGAALLPRSGDPIPVALPLNVPAAAWNGSEYLIADAQPGDAPPAAALLSPDITVFRVTPNGAVLDSRVIAHSTTDVDTVRVASNGNNFLVVWVPNPFLSPSTFGMIVGPNGFAAATDPVALAPSNTLEPPAITALGSTYVVAWRTKDGVLQWRYFGGTVQSLAAAPTAGYAPGLAAATIGGSRLMFAYTRIDDSAGGVPRVFVRSVIAPRVRVAR
jgi:hypothetical protein